MGFQWDARRWLSPALPARRGLLAPSSGCCPLTPLPCATSLLWDPLSPQGTSSPLGDVGWDPVALEMSPLPQRCPMSSGCLGRGQRDPQMWGRGTLGCWGCRGTAKGGVTCMSLSPGRAGRPGQAFPSWRAALPIASTPAFPVPAGEGRSAAGKREKKRNGGDVGPGGGGWGSRRSLQHRGSPPLGCLSPSVPVLASAPGFWARKGGEKGEKEKNLHVETRGPTAGT